MGSRYIFPQPHPGQVVPVLRPGVPPTSAAISQDPPDPHVPHGGVQAADHNGEDRPTLTGSCWHREPQRGPSSRRQQLLLGIDPLRLWHPPEASQSPAGGPWVGPWSLPAQLWGPGGLVGACVPVVPAPPSTALKGPPALTTNLKYGKQGASLEKSPPHLGSWPEAALSTLFTAQHQGNFSSPPAYVLG